jgi:hypothetical protein
MDHPLTPTEFVNDNLIPTTLGRKCFSGRYNTDQNTGMIARPGADFGYVMAMLGYNYEQKLGFSVQECVKAVYDAIIAIDGTFYMHTDDTHTKNSPYSFGCSHAMNATNESISTTYDIQALDVQEAIRLLQDNTDMPISITTLSGNHREEGVLIVKSEEYTVNTHDDTHRYYIYDKKRDDLFIKTLVENISISDLVYENFQRVATLQLGATLQAEAKGLPIFEIYIFDETQDIQIKNTGTV